MNVCDSLLNRRTIYACSCVDCIRYMSPTFNWIGGSGNCDLINGCTWTKVMDVSVYDSGNNNIAPMPSMYSMTDNSVVLTVCMNHHTSQNNYLNYSLCLHYEPLLSHGVWIECDPINNLNSNSYSFNVASLEYYKVYYCEQSSINTDQVYRLNICARSNYVEYYYK